MGAEGLLALAPGGDAKRPAFLAFVRTAEEGMRAAGAGAHGVCLDAGGWSAAGEAAILELKRACVLLRYERTPPGAVEAHAVLVQSPGGGRIVGAETVLVLGANAATRSADSARETGDVLLDTGSERLLDHVAFADLSAFAQACREAGRSFGFAGALEAADIPRLVPLQPSFLGFDQAMRDPAGALDAAACRALAALLADRPSAPVEAHPHPDRVFVRDLVEEMEVGAYGSERGRRQRVRFSMEAELAPVAGARTLGDIYSYDRMIDAARALAARGHEAFVETLAEDLARELLGDGRVAAVTVRVEKLDLGPGSAGVEIRRARA